MGETIMTTKIKQAITEVKCAILFNDNKVGIYPYELVGKYNVSKANKKLNENPPIANAQKITVITATTSTVQYEIDVEILQNLLETKGTLVVDTEVENEVENV